MQSSFYFYFFYTFNDANVLQNCLEIPECNHNMPMQYTPQYYYPFMFGPPPFVPIQGKQIYIKIEKKLYI